MGNHQDRLLIEYLPDVIKGIREYKVLMNAEQPEIYDLFSEIQIALDNQFVLSSTEYGVKRWEKMLKIIPKATYSLDERKLTILSRLAEMLPFTYRMLERMLTQLCGEDEYILEPDFNNYSLQITVLTNSKAGINEVRGLAKRVIPANIGVIFISIFEFPKQDISVKIAAAVFPEITITKLPQYIPVQDYKRDIHISSFCGSVEQTAINPITQGG